MPRIVKITEKKNVPVNKKNFYLGNIVYFCQIMTSQKKVTFGEYIKELRINQKFTLTQLAAKLDLDSANLSKIENGKRDFDEKRLFKLAKVFKLNTKELQREFVSDQIAKKIFECNCTKEMLVAAEEKAEYRRQLNNQFKKEKVI